MDPNLETYSSKRVVNWYQRLHEITAVENIIFGKYRDLIGKGNVLDMGIGGGRTTGYLVKRCHKYTGIDYSQRFVEFVKKKYPDQDLRIADARDLSQFEDNSFDFVNFSFNGIDYVDLAGRQKILSEIHRVLKPGGLFFFSTHNQLHPSFNNGPWLNATNSTFTNIKTFVKLFPFFLRKLKNRKSEVFCADYSIINDAAHNYRLFTFYTTPRFLREQLNAQKFGNIDLYSKAGEMRPDEGLDDWIFVTATKF
jgi:SAM-dependent methyltransferase